jgi:hypothetical protein
MLEAGIVSLAFTFFFLIMILNPSNFQKLSGNTWPEKGREEVKRLENQGNKGGYG